MHGAKREMGMERLGLTGEPPFKRENSWGISKKKKGKGEEKGEIEGVRNLNIPKKTMRIPQGLQGRKKANRRGRTLGNTGTKELTAREKNTDEKKKGLYIYKVDAKEKGNRPARKKTL